MHPIRDTAVSVARLGAAMLAGAVLGLLLLPCAGALAQAGARPGTPFGPCQIAGREANLGPTYVGHVAVSGGAGCPQAVRLIGAFYRCQVRHGGIAGSCPSLLEGFRCLEDRYDVVTVQYQARVSCTRGRQRARYEYTQIT
jgi:hypothetical protein